MSLSVLFLPLLLAATPVPPAPVTSPNRCPKPAVTTESARFNRLGDLPPAEAFKAVWRSSECAVSPILARDRMGPVPRPRR